MTTVCSHCRQMLSVDDELFGRTVRCPVCSEPFVVSVADLSESGASTRPAACPSTPAGDRFAESGQGPALGEPPAASSMTGQKIGRFELQGILGSGGYGVVYRAYDPLLDRTVALKIPRISEQADQKGTRRFLAEAKAAARLRHPGIVSVFESGFADGRYYLATEFVKAETLSERLKGGRPPLELAARWILHLAQALDYAHSEGVVHRDIKPDNILLDDNDRPQIMDFGLAKRLDEESSLTIDGSVVGTPAYMAPEQARGELHRVGPHSDQYSLGAVLYELLTGARPFSGPPHAVISQVAEVEPKPPRSLNPAIPKDLEAICRQAMEKDPARRYRTCGELALDLERWLSGRETVARPLGLFERALRYSRRHPATALWAAAFLLTVFGALAAVSWQWRRAESAHRTAVDNFREAQRQRRRAERHLVELRQQRDLARDLLRQANEKQALLEQSRIQLQQALTEAEQNLAEAQRQRARAEQNLAEANRQSQRADRNRAIAEREEQAARHLLAKENSEAGLKLAAQGRTASALLWLARGLADVPDGSDLDHLIRANLGFLEDQTHRLVGFARHDGPVRAVSGHPKNLLLVSGSEDGTVRLWDPASLMLTADPVELGAPVTATAISPDGRYMLVAAENGNVQLWDLESGELFGKALKHPDAVLSAAFSPDGQAVVTGCADRRARIWNTKTGRIRVANMQHEGPVRAVAFSPDGKAVLTGSGGIVKRAVLWNALTGNVLTVVATVRHDIRAVAFSPNGKQIAVAGDDQTVRVWDVGAEKLRERPRPVVQSSRPILALAFSPNGRYLLTGGADGTARLWDLSGEPLGDPLPHQDAVMAVAFAEGGKTILTGSADGVLRVWWNAYSGTSFQPLKYDSPVTGIALSPDGKTLLTGSPDRTARLWDLVSGTPLGPPLRHLGPVTALAFATDGRSVLTGSDDKLARLWDAVSMERLGPRLTHQGRVTAACFAPGGKLAVTAASDGTAQVWSLPDGRAIGKRFPPAEARASQTGRAADGQRTIVDLAFGPDGRTVLTGSTDGSARLWEARTGVPVTEPLRHQASITCVDFAPDGNLVATSAADGTARLWSAVTGRLVHEFRHRGAILALAFSPDGRALLTGSADGTARLWSAESGEALSDPLQHEGAVNVVGFSSDGLMFFTAGDDRAVRLWDTATGRPIGRPLLHDGKVTDVVIDGAATALVVLTDKHAVRTWWLPAPWDLPPQQAQLWAEVATAMRLDENGQIQVLSPEEWLERQRRLMELPGQPDRADQASPTPDDR